MKQTVQKIEVKLASIEAVVALSQQIPELVNPYPTSVYEERLLPTKHLILIAFVEGEAAGFKVGYEREAHYFYSWMGGVRPQFRRMGVAKRLATAQENWAKAQGYAAIQFKTRNRLKAMLTFSINNGFQIIAVEKQPTIEEYRIWLRKEL